MPYKAQNMMVIMLDPHFQALHIVKTLVGHGNVIKLAFENDAKIVIPLLMVCLEWLNLSIVAIVIANDDVRLELEENILGWGPQLKIRLEH
jgi:hypothetical protein